MQQARKHEKPRTLQDLDQAELFPAIEIEEQFIYEHEHLLLGINYALMKSTQTNHSLLDRDLVDRNLVDRDLIAALVSLAKSYETLVGSGLHYSAAAASGGQHEIAAEVQKMIKEYREAEQKHAGYSKLHDSDVLRALVFTLRIAYSRTSGRPKSKAYIDFLSSQFPEKQPAIASSGRIITP